MTAELATRYDPQSTEPKWIETWAKAKVGRADPSSAAARAGRVFTIFIPPPNVTGVLHMGHGLNNTLQDTLVRFHRMRGFETLWLAGTDHAGIATQNVVERQLAKAGKKRQDIGREAFVAEVWRWKDQYEAHILGQLRRLGASPDWDRTRFTMDQGLSAAVRHVFVDLYHRGYVYRGLRLVNWCPRCVTAISDDEVTHEPREGHLYWIRYPWADSSDEGGAGGALTDGGLTVATTRPETMLGDTGVAVNPDDERYASLVGRKLRLPLVGREIPVVADAYVEKSFGAGALKVTPAHDPNDWEIGQRHKLAAICVIAKDGTMSDEAPAAYRGLDRFDARKRIVADLEAGGFLVKTDPNPHSIGTCDRCHSVLEPLPSTEWFVRLRERSPKEPDRPSLAELAIAATREGRVRLVPERWTGFYMSWLENVRDWCISRQLWWGHRIPVFTCGKCGHVDAYETDPAACPKSGANGQQCGGAMTQDQDVLDTWFSSDLWPLSTLGWPEQTPELEVFYPSSVLSTARDILFLWVARMVMMGELYAPRVKTRGGRTEPFRDVYVHATVLDKVGRRMSKSLGNGVDPIEMAEKYGADAVRFTLVWITTEAQDLKLDETRFEMGRNFMNKLWNAARFSLAAVGDAKPSSSDLAVEDRWIRTELTRTQRDVASMLADYKFSNAAQAIYEFVWNQFCDWYLELVKPRLQAGGASAEGAKATLVHVLTGICRTLHPIAPHITEELWEHLRPWHGAKTLLAKSDWGEETFEDAAAGSAIAAVQETVRAVRNLRAESRVPEKEKVDVLVVPKSGADDVAAAVRAQAPQILRLCQASTIRVENAPPPKDNASAVTSLGDVFIDLAGKIDVAAERARLAKELEKAEKTLAATKAKLSNENFVSRAKPEVVEQERRRLAESEEQVVRLRKLLDSLGG